VPTPCVGNILGAIRPAQLTNGLRAAPTRSSVDLGKGFKMTPNLWRAFVAVLLLAAGQTAVAEDKIRIRIENNYVARLNLGFLVTGEREGTDILDGTLTLQPNGAWVGTVTAEAHIKKQELKGLGATCPRAKFKGKQPVRMVAKPAPEGFSGYHSISNQSGRTDAGHLVLEVEALADPTVELEEGDCIDMYQAGMNSPKLVPLNDARWTQPPYGYVIGLPRSGVLEYDDQTHQDQALGESHWKVRVERL
jgi:hypothetical protein